MYSTHTVRVAVICMDTLTGENNITCTVCVLYTFTVTYADTLTEVGKGEHVRVTVADTDTLTEVRYVPPKNFPFPFRCTVNVFRKQKSNDY